MSLFYFDSQFSLLCCVSLIFFSFTLLYYYLPALLVFTGVQLCFCVISSPSYLSLSLSLLEGLPRLTFSAQALLGYCFVGIFSQILARPCFSAFVSSLFTTHTLKCVKKHCVDIF